MDEAVAVYKVAQEGLIDAVVVELSARLRQHWPTAASVRLEAEWTEDHLPVLAIADVHDAGGTVLGYDSDPASVEELLSWLAEVGTEWLLSLPDDERTLDLTSELRGGEGDWAQEERRPA